MRDVLTHLTDSCKGHDYVGITLRVPPLQRPAWLSFRQAREISFDDVCGLFNSILQSAREFQIESGMCEMSTCVVSGVEGSGCVTLRHETIAKKSILTINNTDHSCLPRSLVAARAHAECEDLGSGEFHKNWRRISDGRRETQRSAALELVHRGGVEIPARGCGLREIRQFLKSLANEGIAIVVYEFLTFGKRTAALYDGRQSIISATGAIKHTDQQSNHYQPILNLAAALGSRGFCTLCNVTYTLAIEHRCSRQCPRCKSAECVGDEENIRYCRDCNRRFFGNACLAQRKKAKSAGLRGGRREASVCQELQNCRACSYLVRTNSSKEHVCDMSFCSTCMQLRPSSHACFIAPLGKKKNSDSSDPNEKTAHYALYFMILRHSSMGICPATLRLASTSRIYAWHSECAPRVWKMRK